MLDDLGFFNERILWSSVEIKSRSSHHGSAITNLTNMCVRSLVSLIGLRIQRCHELWCRSQRQLRSFVAVAVAKASGHSSDSTPSLGTSICRGHGPKKTRKRKKETYKPTWSIQTQILENQVCNSAVDPYSHVNCEFERARENNWSVDVYAPFTRKDLFMTRGWMTSKHDADFPVSGLTFLAHVMIFCSTRILLPTILK